MKRAQPPRAVIPTTRTGGTPKRPTPAELTTMIDDIEHRPSGAFRTVMATKVIAPQVIADTVEAGTFNLIDAEQRRIATLTSTDEGLPGLALFRPDAKRARAELLLEPFGPVLRLNNEKGHIRLTLRYHDKTGEVSAGLFGPSGHERLVLLVDRDRPHVVVFPRGRKDRHGVAFVPAAKLPPRRGAWARALRAARSGQRQAFENAALDSGILAPQLDGVWDLITRNGSRATRRRVASRR